MSYDLVTVNPMVLHGPYRTTTNKITFQGLMIDNMNHQFSARVPLVMIEVTSPRHWTTIKADFSSLNSLGLVSSFILPLL